MIPTVPFIGDAAAVGLLDLDRAYAAVADAYRQAAAAGPVLSTPPALLMCHPSAPRIEMKAKGAQLPRQRVAGFRIVADRHDAEGDVSHDVQWLYDMDTARPLGMVEMNTLHAVRTALTGVVALEALRGRACEKVAVLGAGRIAKWLVRVLAARTAPREIRVVGFRPGRGGALAASHGASVVGVDTVDDAVAGADAVIGISSARQPILHARHLRPGMTVIGMGGGHEFDVSVLHAAGRFIVDELAFASVTGSLGAWIAAGTLDGLAAHARLDAELGQVLQGAAGRTGPDQIVFAIVQGMACCDLAVAADILARGTAGPHPGPFPAGGCPDMLPP
jgi:ornithine cyclodeaminase/alanine dehydrogenase-like protein (mu-crystallin family)